MRARTAEAPESGDRRQQHSYPYDAFLSYDHDDQPVAYGIQRGLHKVGRRFGQLHALRVFRDSTDLTASPDLWGKVTEAMGQSRYLIVVLSPHAVVSKWVDREVAHWLGQRGPDRMLFVVAGGTVAWDAASARFDPDRSDAALPSLTRPGALPTEPLYVDVSKNAPWDPEAALFREKVTDLAAPIHGKPKYELASEDLREQRKSRRFRRAAFVLLALLTACAVAAAGIAYVEKQVADRQREEAVRQRNNAEARRLASEAADQLAGTRPGGDVPALQKLLAADALAPEIAAGGVFDAASRRRTTVKVADVGARVFGVSFGPAGQLVAVTTSPDGVPRLLDAETGESVGT